MKVTSCSRSGPCCAICGGRLERTAVCIRQPDRFELAVGITENDCHREWRECETCGALSNLRLDGHEARLKEMASAYYAVDYAGSSLAARYAKIMSLPQKTSDNAARVARIVAFLNCWRQNDEGVALDIGAGLGVFLTSFLKICPRWKGVAIEPDPLASAHLRTLLDGTLTVVETRLEETHGTLPGGTLCTLNKVLEHIAEPLPFLRNVAERLTSADSVIYVEVPDKMTAFTRPPSDNILGALHYHLYDMESVCLLLRQAGLLPLRVERILEPSGKLTVYAFATRPTGYRTRCLAE